MQKRKNLSIAMLTTVVLLFIALPILGACGEEEVVEEVIKEAPAEKATAEKWPEAITVGTSPTGGMGYTVGTAYCEMIKKYVGITATPEPATGAGVHISLMKRGESECLVFGIYEPYAATHGIGPYEKEGKQPIRLISQLYLAPWVMAARANSDIYSIGDLRGKRVPWELPGSIVSNLCLQTLYDAYGLTEDDMKPLRMSGADVHPTFREGSLDFLMYPNSITRNIGLWEETSRSIDLRYLSIGETEMAKIREKLPWTSTWVMPAGFIRLQDEPVSTFGFRMIFACRTDLPDSLVYEITKACWEHSDELIQIHAIFGEFMLEDSLIPPFAIPFHQGTVKYLEEKGLWSEEVKSAQEAVLREIGETK